MPTLVIILAAITLVTLFVGLYVMARGSKVKTKNLSNKIMIARVAFQALTIAAIVIGMLVFKE